MFYKGLKTGNIFYNSLQYHNKRHWTPPPPKQIVNKILSNGDKTKKRQRHLDDHVHFVCIITHDKFTSDVKDKLQIHGYFFSH